MRIKNVNHGFTLIEMMTTVAIIAILAGIAIPTFLHFRTKAFAADIVATHEELQEVVYAEAASMVTNDCQVIADHISDKYFTGHAADLHLGTVTIPGGKGYRPVLLVHALKNVNGGTGVKAARIAYDAFESENIIDQDTKKTVEKDVVAYGADLIQGGTPICTQHPLLDPTYPAPAKSLAGSTSTGSAQAGSGSTSTGSTATGSTATGSTATGSDATSGKTSPPPPPAPSQTSFDPNKPLGPNNKNPCPDGKVLVPGQSLNPLPPPNQIKCQKAYKNKPNPYQPTQCQVCSGPPMICERLHHKETCTWPDNICINLLENHDTGARVMTRRCGNNHESNTEWYQGTSDNDRCTTFDPKFVQTLEFQCTFACVTDNCNNDVVPAKDSLWRENQ